jgi:hypothetical protein
MPIDTPSQVMETIRQRLGMMIPVWFPPDLPPERMREALRATLHGCEHYLPWGHVVLIVDGDARSYQIVQELQADHERRDGSAFAVVYQPENRGKGYAVFLGARWLLEQTDLAYLAIRDADGDHALNDLMNLMRLALALRAGEGTEHIMVVGRRSHPHRTLGFVRGEFEILLNRVIVEAVRFALAQRQQVLITRYFAFAGEYPDLHSGYKLYSRSICELLVRQPWERPPWVGREIYRYGVEAVPFVEGAMTGAVVGEITRLTVAPDFSGHAGFGRPENNGGVLLWTFLRLGIKPHQAAALLDNHLSRVALWTDPSGRQALLELRRLVLSALPPGGQAPAPTPKSAPYF